MKTRIVTLTIIVAALATYVMYHAYFPVSAERNGTEMEKSTDETVKEKAMTRHLVGGKSWPITPSFFGGHDASPGDGSLSETEMDQHIKTSTDQYKTLSVLYASLEKSDHLSLPEKTSAFTTSLGKTFAGFPDSLSTNERHVLATAFFSLKTVQNDLKELEPATRQYEMNKVRRELGFSESEIEAMAEIDDQRNRRWETGIAYMEDREALIARFTGHDREDKLENLRETYFREESRTIAMEEQNQFFRFNRPRVYGRN